MFFLSPSQRGGAQQSTEPEDGGGGEGSLLLEPVVKETIRFEETKTNRFMHRDNQQTGSLRGRVSGFSPAA